MNDISNALNSLDFQAIQAGIAATRQKQIARILNIPPVGTPDSEYEEELERDRWEAESGKDTDWQPPTVPEIEQAESKPQIPTHFAALPKPVIELSHEQQIAVEAMKLRKSFCLIGKAGTGKTTTVKEAVAALERDYVVPPMDDIEGHKYLVQGSLGIVCCAFTNRAINNISKSFDLSSTMINFMTIHKLLEFIREDYAYEDPETKELRNSSRFVPSRNEFRKLPHGLKTIIIEEASMVSIDLWTKLRAACHDNMQFVFLGDLQQLPPPYGDGILGYKLNELPCLELTKIYRQAAENPIIALAWDISSGTTLGKKELEERFKHFKSLDDPIRVTFFQKKIAADMATVTMGTFFCNLIDRNILDPMNDIILMPENGTKSERIGTIPINKRIAQHLSEKAGHETYEILAGFQKHYFAIGDKVLYNKKEGIITKITRNAKYIGKSPLPASIDLHRDGSYHAKDSKGAVIPPDQMSGEDVDKFLMHIMESSDDDTTNQASHILQVRLISEQLEDGSTEVDVSTRGEYANLLLAYAITIHKAQGSEWRKVFLLMHNSNFTVNREMLYTAVTRASQQLFVMCESDSFSRAIAKQRIPGITLQEKIRWFKQKIDEMKSKKVDATRRNAIQLEDDE